MFTKIRITLDRIEVADRGVLFAWAVWAVLAVGFGVEALRDWNGATGGETMWERWFATVGFAFVLVSAWRMRGVHVVTHEGERIDVVAFDQTDLDRFTSLANALREMLARPGGATPPPSPPHA